MRLQLQTDPARSALMKRIRQKKTSAEETVAQALRKAGIAYRRNVSSLPGSPDFANKKQRWAIFVMGCFWHHHSNCRRARIPGRNREFWSEKLARNRRRDAQKIRLLRHLGLRVIILWECELYDHSNRSAVKLQILKPRRVYLPQPLDH